MDYLNNITLTIFIILLIRGRLTLSTPDLESMKELKMYISTLDGFFKNRPEDMTIEEKEQFEESYHQTISYTIQNKELTVICDNLERLESFLKEYVENYNNGLLEEDSNHNEFDTISSLDKMLISNIKDTTKNKARYIETAIKYAPLILLKYFENRDFIKDITIELASQKEEIYPMMLFKPENETDGVNGEYVDNWQDYFRCKYILDMEWYWNEYNFIHSKNITKERRKKFAPLQEKVYKYIYKNATNGVFVLSRTDLKNCLALTHKDKTLNDLRNQYREIYNKHSDFDIIKYNRTTKMYDIHKDILKDKLN